MSTLGTIRNTRIVLGLVGLFFVSGMLSCQELEYLVKGKAVEARLEETHVEKDPEHEGREKRVVGYSFMDKETYRREYADVPLDWSGMGAQTVKVEYLPGWERHSRLVGQNNRVWVYIFFGSLVAAGIGVWSLAREK
jgi:hypothetical protein